MTIKEFTDTLHSDLNIAYEHAIDVAGMLPAVGVRLRAQELVVLGHDDVTIALLEQLESALNKAVGLVKRGIATGGNTRAGQADCAEGFDGLQRTLDELSGFDDAYTQAPAARVLLHALLESLKVIMAKFIADACKAADKAAASAHSLSPDDSRETDIHTAITDNVAAMTGQAQTSISGSVAVVLDKIDYTTPHVADLVRKESGLICQSVMRGVSTWTSIMGVLTETRGDWAQYIGGGRDD